jgi:hypothetical protein
MSGSNVLLYSDGTGSISLTGSGNLTLSPPTSGLYQGISLFQERSSTKQISVTAQENMNVSGRVGETTDGIHGWDITRTPPLALAFQ